MQKTTIHIQGTHCKACKALIEDVCSEVAGVNSSCVNFETGETGIEHDGSLNLESLKNEIESLGDYKVILA